MKEQELFKFIAEIEPLDKEAMDEARARQDILAKPPQSLGKLEEISIRLAGITGRVKNSLAKGCIAIFASDNGVVSEGVASAPQSVTMAQTINFTRRLTGVGALAKTFNRQICVVDMGINADLPKELLSDNMADFEADKIINRKIAYGTKNLAKEPAMTREEAIHAISVGIETAKAIKAAGYEIMGIGEMGIGNTTTSAAILTGLTDCSVDISVGRGGGLTDMGLLKKREIVKEVGLNRNYKDIPDLISSIGGFDICAMAGAYLGAAHEKLPVVIDGYISAVAALVAFKLCNTAKEYFFGSHASEEKGYGFAMSELDMEHMLSLNMRLGEGSGCVLAMEVIAGAVGVMNYMGTFDEAAIDDKYLDEIREGNCF